MSGFFDEEVPPVNPLSVGSIEEVGRCLLDQLAPMTLEAPKPLDVLGLVDNCLPQFGIHACPASRAELGNRDGATDPKGDGEVTILLSEEVWDQLEQPAPRSHYARTTVCHELGHAILHVPVLRRRLLVHDMLARSKRGELRPFEDPEWQAWAFAGAVLMPSVTLRILLREHNGLTPQLVSSTYEVSQKMAASHLRRLKWLNQGEGQG